MVDVCGWCLWLMFVVGVGVDVGVGVGVPGLLDFMQVGHIDVLQWFDSQ